MPKEREPHTLKRTAHGGVIKITMRFLEDALRLPKGHRILRVCEPPEHTFHCNHEVEMIIEGPGLPLVREGERYPSIVLTLSPDGSISFGD